MDTSKVGFSCISSNAKPEQWAHGLKEMGFSAWEYVADGDDALSPERLSLLQSVKDSTQLTITVHAPFSDLNFASLRAGVWELSIQSVVDTMKALSDISEMITVHPGHLSPYAMGKPDMAKQRLIDAMKRLGAAAGEHGFRVGLENMPEFQFIFGRTRDEIEEVLGAVDSEHVGMTLDVGHANTTKTLTDFLGCDYIVHAHIHDNYGDHDSHLTIGEGNIDWKRVMDSLSKRSIKMIVEAHTVESGVASLNFLRSL
ncbi:MAG: sugar phosphate isomerase/epimerase family protein [Methermicoccaceae archaeon]